MIIICGKLYPESTGVVTEQLYYGYASHKTDTNWITAVLCIIGQTIVGYLDVMDLIADYH